VQYPGLQAHRSWWVAKSAITSMKKEGRKTFLLMGNDLEVPISRTYAASVKDANIH
jgi:DNA-binding LytR/AlgR family response regulator